MSDQSPCKHTDIALVCSACCNEALQIALDRIRQLELQLHIAETRSSFAMEVVSSKKE